jgi:hypothetical protein
VLDCGGQLESIVLNAKDPAGNALGIDIGWFGSPSPRRALIHSSGLHGIEGFAGSAIQQQWLADGIPNTGPDDAIAIVHALNPFGMAWLRRANENNVDLSHNFPGADQAFAGSPADYAALDTFLNPQSPTPDFFPARAALAALRHGMPALRRAIDRGQYDFPRGLGFGGERHEQGPRRFQVYIASRLSSAERLVAIDVHTGPGKTGRDRLTTAAASPMHEAYGDCVQDSPGQTTGGLEGLYTRMSPAAQVCFTVQEFGTGHPLKILAALRDENRCHHFGFPGDAGYNRAKAKLLEAFCPSDRKWRGYVLRRGKEVIEQGLSLTFSSG